MSAPQPAQLADSAAERAAKLTYELGWVDSPTETTDWMARADTLLVEVVALLNRPDVRAALAQLP